MLVRANGAVLEDVSLASLVTAGGGDSRPGVEIHFESVERYKAGPTGRGVGEALKWSTIQADAKVCEVLWPELWLIAAIGLVLHLVFNRRERSMSAIAVLALTSLVAVVTRAFVIAYIQATSWTFAVSPFYLAPAYAFGVVFALSGSYLLLRSVRMIHVSGRIVDVTRASFAREARPGLSHPPSTRW